MSPRNSPFDPSAARPSAQPRGTPTRRGVAAGGGGRGADGAATRRRLIGAARELLWRDGYAATSPRDLQRAAGAGQGSFYHHFDGKAALCAAALAEEAASLIAACDRAFDRAKPPLERIRDFLNLPQDGEKGCRLGRHAFDPGLSDPAVAGPVAAYLAHVEGCLVEALAEAARGGEIDSGADVEALAEALLAAMQGGYVLARVHGDPRALAGAVRGALALLDGLAR